MIVRKMMSKPWGHLAAAVLLIGIPAFLLVDCAGKRSIRIGFVAQLTGAQAELGVQERNGVQLAVEQINTGARVAGHPIELIVRNDLGTPEGARAADRELIDAGVAAIIGHATSGMTLAGLTVTNPARVVMLSPTATTPELSGKDDYFFRVCYSLDGRATVLAQYIYKRRNLTRMGVIYDTDNAAYSKDFLIAFAAKYRSLGGEMAAESGFSSKAQPDMAPFVKQLRASGPEGLLIIASDMDTALIAQRTHLMGWAIPLFTTAWAQTETLINNGGRAVEGLEFESAIRSTNSRTPDYLEFKTRYKARFGQAPSFGAVLGYEASEVLTAALRKTGGKADGLRQALTGIKNLKGLDGTISFDKYGDVIRPYCIGAIRDGKYVDIELFEPTEQ